GTYTAKTNSKGIYEFRFDSATGKMSTVGVAAEAADPSWVVVHPSRKYLYSVNETGKASTVSAFAIEPKSGKLTLLNQLPALGEDPCYLSFDRTGKFLFVAIIPAAMWWYFRFCRTRNLASTQRCRKTAAHWD